MGQFFSKKQSELITNSSLIFLLSLWFLNPSNKQIVFFFAVFFIFLYLRIKNVHLGLLITWILSSIIFSGKTHIFKLLNLSEFPFLRFEYPDLGYFITLVIRVVDVISFLMLIVIIFTFVKNRKLLKPNIFDLLLVFYGLWAVISNLVVSGNLFVSIYMNMEIFNALILNLFLKMFINNKEKSHIIYNLAAVIIIFQLFVSSQQFIQTSVLGKNIESLPSLPKFGGVADEFTAFRPIGTFIHANFMAMYIAPFLIIFFCFYLISPSFNLGLITALMSGAILIVMTLSRSAWGSLTLGFLVLLHRVEYSLKINVFSRLKKILLVFALIMVPLLVYSFPRIAKSLYAFQPSGGGSLRVRQIKESLVVFYRSPIFGVGSAMNVVKAIERDKFGVFIGFPAPVHNYFVLELVEKGIVNLIILISLVFVFFSDMIRSIKGKSKNQQILGLGLTTAGAVLIMSSFFQPFMFLHLLVYFHHLKDYS